MDILSKLAQVEIQITDRFPAEDMEYCRQAERDYQDAFCIYSEFSFFATDTNERIRALPKGPYTRLVDECHDKISECSERFINMICSHFREKYSVRIDNLRWEVVDHDKRGRRTEARHDIVPLQDILDSVYEQMGGMSFEEKAFDELKADAREAVINYHDNSKYIIKGVKLIVDEFYWSHKCRIFERYEADVENKHRAFFRALSHFEYGSYDLARKYNFLCEWRISEQKGAYDKHEISSSIITSIKVFKNGKVEFEFKNYHTAVEFMEIYFPGIPQKTAA